MAITMAFQNIVNTRGCWPLCLMVALVSTPTTTRPQIVHTRNAGPRKSEVTVPSMNTTIYDQSRPLLVILHLPLFDDIKFITDSNLPYGSKCNVGVIAIFKSNLPITGRDIKGQLNCC
jgi:hypothetical protein